jgi:hypothetical protein
MKQEEINQEVRKGGLVVVATAKLREKILERTRRLIDGVQYVTLADLLREVNEIKSMLSRLRQRGQKYAVAVDAQTAQSVMLALLLVPERQADLESGGNKAGQTGTAKTAAELAKAADDARRIAGQLWGKPDSVPTIEGWDRELSKLGKEGKLAGQLLVAPRTEGGKVHDALGRPLIELPAAPKALPSEGPKEVQLSVGPVDPETGFAVVRVMSAADPDGPAMRGLFERRVPLAFDDERLRGIAKLLELAQVTDTLLRVRVGVTRGLTEANAKLDSLQLAEVIDEAETRRRMSRRLLEMEAVTEDLFHVKDA